MKKLSDFYKSRSTNTELVRRVSSLTFVEVDNSVYDIIGDVDFNDLELSSLLKATVFLKELTSSKAPIRLRRVQGDFKCNRNHLTDLKGAPEYVGNNFDCSYNKLVSLEGAPKYVGGVFECGLNPRKFTVEEVRKLISVKDQIWT